MADSVGGYCPQCGQYVVTGDIHYCKPMYYVGGQYCYRCGEFYLTGVQHTCKDKGNNTTTYSYYFVTKEEVDGLKERIKSLEMKVERLSLCINFYPSLLSVIDRLYNVLDKLEEKNDGRDSV